MRLYRMHLKTDAGTEEHKDGSREELINNCLHSVRPYLAIGWSYLYKTYAISDFKDYLDAYLEAEGKFFKNNLIPCAFAQLKKDDLVWTRDLNGIYYLCRITGEPTSAQNIEDHMRLDIGAAINADVVKVGLSVPGTIVSRMYSSNGKQPALQAINNENMMEYSKRIYNELTESSEYTIYEAKYDIFELLDDKDLEELVLDYLQIKYDYYLSPSSIAKRSTTIKIECELFPREGGQQRKSAVVQVKKMRNTAQPVDYYNDYCDKENKEVFIFYGDEDYTGYKKEIHTISKDELKNFIRENKARLPYSIQKWCDFCEDLS